jgi:hypothetical protein
MLGDYMVSCFVIGTTVRSVGQEDAVWFILGAVPFFTALATGTEFSFGLGLLSSAVLLAGLGFSASHNPASELRFPMPSGRTPVPPCPSPVRS